MGRDGKAARFEELLIPHLDSAYNLARWLSRDDHDAQDIVQEAFARAFRYFDSYQPGNARAWLLKIVRNSYYSWLSKRQGEPVLTAFDPSCEPAWLAESADAPWPQPPESPESLLQKLDDVTRVREGLAGLADNYREVMVLREIEGLSYREIADVAEIPIGTVMSRLARARKQLQQDLAGHAQGQEVCDEL